MTSSHSSARQKAVTQSGISLYSLTNKVFLFHDRGRTSGNRSGRGGEPSARSCCRIRVSEGLNIITLQRFLSLVWVCQVSHKHIWTRFQWIWVECDWAPWGDRLSHRLQLTSFSPLWTLMCRFRFPSCANLWPQTEQLNGFSPTWTAMCCFRSLLSAKPSPQSEQLMGFSLVWAIMCCLR